MHAHTPHLTVSDPRGLAVRSVNYCRVVPGTPAELRIHHTRFDALGRQVEQRDPRLWVLPQAPANLATVHTLSGQVLGTDGVDNGWQRRLPGEARQMIRQWDGRGSQRRVEYDELLRPLAIFEQLEQQTEQCSERLAYADGSVGHSQHNRCGRLIRHDDPAGSLEHSAFSLKGEASIQRRRFLEATDWPDWPVDSDARDALLEPGEGATTLWQHGPLGQALEQTDAGGHRQSFHSNLSGELHQVRLQLAGQPVKTLLEDARYNAMAQVLEETLGNGVTTRRTYRGEDGRMLSLSARRKSGDILQDIHYDYDPAGNVISLEDRAQPLRHFANQRIEPRCEYRYDSLYQLIEATGWEAGAASKGPGTLNDPQARSNYRQTYRYDAGGNLLDLTHVGAQSHSRRLGAARHSNRCLAYINGRPPSDEDFLERFDANGNLLALQPGSRLHWDVRNQLSDVQPVSRKDTSSDTERYHYDAAGQRVRKRRSTQAAGRSLLSEVRYLSGLEVHENQASGEHLQAVTVQAGTCSVRVLHWLAGRPDEVAQDQQRYSLTDHLSSHALELDQSASLISHEVFHPFGSTAWWAARSDIEASYKTVRYSGKERDMTGLYYYGARYYMPWLQRWLNPDPAGAADGLNLFRMVKNSPISNFDPNGLETRKTQERWQTLLRSYNKSIASVAPGIVRVRLRGGPELFEAAGFQLGARFSGERMLTYLSLDQGYRGKIAANDRGRTEVSIATLSGGALTTLAKTSNTDFTAFVNGSFFNFRNMVSSSVPSASAIGASQIDGGPGHALPIPSAYDDWYTSVTMSDQSYIHSAPLLASSGRAVFTSDRLEESRFRFSRETNHPGWLSHADQPNVRSAISLAGAQGGANRTRLVVGPAIGRGEGTGGYTLPEWAQVLARLDRLNPTPGQSVNLDGGSSSLLGVVSRSGSILTRGGYLEPDAKPVANFIAFARRAR